MEPPKLTKIIELSSLSPSHPGEPQTGDNKYYSTTRTDVWVTDNTRKVSQQEKIEREEPASRDCITFLWKFLFVNFIPPIKNLMEKFKISKICNYCHQSKPIKCLHRIHVHHSIFTFGAPTPWRSRHQGRGASPNASTSPLYICIHTRKIMAIPISYYNTKLTGCTCLSPP